jgi:hypothetical protein
MDYLQKTDSDMRFVGGPIQTSPPVVEQPAVEPEEEKSTADEFKGGLVPLQIRVPSDMRESLKLLSYDGQQSMSDLVMRCLTTDAVIHRAWIQQRKKTKKAA